MSIEEVTPDQTEKAKQVKVKNGVKRCPTCKFVLPVAFVMGNCPNCAEVILE